jgi:hypothetical protein
MKARQEKCVFDILITVFVQSIHYKSIIELINKR